MRTGSREEETLAANAVAVQPRASTAGSALISVVICTLDRPKTLPLAVRSVLASAHDNFELIVIDQSEGKAIPAALKPCLSDPRLRYVRTQVRGKAVAANRAIAEARGEVIAMTDDDCEVPSDWLDGIVEAFSTNPRVGVMFSTVSPVAYDAHTGFIPTYERAGDAVFTSVLDKWRARGIGASMAVRRSMMLELGGFDSLLGPGGFFRSCDDRDIALRALLFGYSVYETDRYDVKHSGFRSKQEWRRLSWQHGVGIGAAYAKPLKCGYWRAGFAAALEFFHFAVWPLVWDLAHFRRPRGLVRSLGFLQGFSRGLMTPVDRDTLRFRPDDKASALRPPRFISS
jgi:glycosyltransferase involved in cell wall biosynthesis